MGLFQHSVLSKYLREVNTEEMKAAWEKIVAYFQSPEIQKYIRELKEEEYQGGFLTELFVNVLGYTLKPNSGYNLTREFKNEQGAKKADGAILKEGAAILSGEKKEFIIESEKVYLTNSEKFEP